MSQYSVKLQNFDKQDSINKAIIDRQITETGLEPNLDFRPIPTKYNHFSIFGEVNQATKPAYPVYDIKSMYNSGNKMSHFSGFSNNVDSESVLQNRVYALQNDSRAVYVPESNSSLYNSYVPNQITTNKDIDNYHVFNSTTFNNHNPNYSESIGSNYFNNSTRYQLKNL